MKDYSHVEILDIGSGIESGAAEAFKDFPGEKHITRLDINPSTNPDVLHDITQPLPEELRSHFDIVYAAHVLEYIDRGQVVNTLRNIISAVSNMGEVWIFTPSLDWIAAEIVKNHDTEYIQAALYGIQADPQDYIRCGFTLNALRRMVEICGLLPRKAYKSAYIVTAGGKEFTCAQNVVVGLRVDGIEGDPTEAISEQSS